MGELPLQDLDGAVSVERVEALVETHYDTLHRIARAKRLRAKAGETLLTTDLLHESWLKIRGKSEWVDEAHFVRTAAVAMQHVLIDYARAKLAKKRGDGAIKVNYDDVAESLPGFRESPETIVAIASLMDGLDDVKPRLSEIVTLRFFAGFTEEETADALGITSRTVRRDWTLAKAWLASQMLPVSGAPASANPRVA